MATLLPEAERIRGVYDRRAGAGWYNHDPAHLFILQSLERRILSLFRVCGISVRGQRILEVGCGSGYWLRQFIQWGARPDLLAGVDIQPERIVQAAARCPASVRLHATNADGLPFQHGSFDLVSQFVMFSSVLDADLRQTIAREMLRVTARDGAILWYDFFVDNPRNPDVRGIRLSELRALFPGCSMDIRRVTLAPPIARRLAKYSWLGCYVLDQLRVVNVFYLAVIRKLEVSK